MADFYLDFRPMALRAVGVARAAGSLAHGLELDLDRIERAEFAFLGTRTGPASLWGPCVWREGDREVVVALAGRLAWEEDEWSETRLVGEGGRACQILCTKYLRESTQALETLNGNFVAVVYDSREPVIHVVSDAAGMVMAYGKLPLTEVPVLSSHPDVLARALGEEQAWDRCSMAQFVMTGCLTFPHTYFKNLRAVEPGSIHTFRPRGEEGIHHETRRSFAMEYDDSLGADPEAAAAELGEAFGRAIRRRSLPVFGVTGVALSGGLDSRLVLASVHPKADVRTFCLCDEVNFEVQIAQRIASACGRELTLYRRDPDYYAREAQLGVRLNGGVGSIASNHFLGIRGFIAQQGIQNLLTGCYCDYLFKGLALNTVEEKWTRDLSIGRFGFQFYRDFAPVAANRRAEVEARLREVFPEQPGKALDDEGWWRVEYRRSFPLAYEADLAQRVIAQRALPWFVPAADRDVLKVYRRLAPSAKVGSELFRKMLRRVCGQELLRIPDANTGAPVDCGRFRLVASRYRTALLNRIVARIVRGRATRGSWPNWEYSLRHSDLLRRLWGLRSARVDHVLADVLGATMPLPPVETYARDSVEYFLRLLTLRLWLLQWD